MFFKSGPDPVSAFYRLWLGLVISSSFAGPLCLCRVLLGITLAVTPLQVRSLNPLGSTHQKHAFSMPSAVSAALAQLHLLLLIQIDLPRLALTVSSCVSAINNPLRPILSSHIPTWRLALCQFCVPFPLFSTSAVALTLAISLYPTIVLVFLLPS